MTRSIMRAAAAALALIAAQTALAAPEVPGGYVGARFGNALDNRFEGVPEVDSDDPLSLYGGWNFSEHWGMEFSYIDLGDTSAPGLTDFGIDVDGYIATGGVTFRQPIAEQFDLFAGLGLFAIREDGTALTFGGPVAIENDDEGVYAEVGARFHFNDNFALRGSYQWFREVGIDNIGAGAGGDDDGTPWIGVEYSF
jgi:hypothetical protein